jgi:hypothetical protein
MTLDQLQCCVHRMRYVSCALRMNLRQNKFWNLGIFAKIDVHFYFIRSGLTCFKSVYQFVIIVVVINKSVGKNGKVRPTTCMKTQRGNRGVAVLFLRPWR